MSNPVPPAKNTGVEESKRKDKLRGQRYALIVTVFMLIIMIFATVILLVPGMYHFETGGDIFSISKMPNGLRVGDEEGTWQHYTQVAIFRTYYENDEMKVIAQSSDGNNIIAPGTSNDYRFYLQNTSNTSISFALDLVAVITVKNYDGMLTQIPVGVKLCRYDGVYLVGGENEWTPVHELNGNVDEGAISARSYVYYTLTWKWEYEGNDMWDTYLGFASAGSSIELTLSIGAAGKGASAGSTHNPIGEELNGCGCAVCLCWLWIVIIFVLLIGEIVTLVFLGKYMNRCKKYEDKYGPLTPGNVSVGSEVAEATPEKSEVPEGETVEEGEAPAESADEEGTSPEADNT